MGGVLYACPLGGRTWKEWGRGRGHVQHAFSSLTVNSEDDRFGVRPRLETGRTSLHLKHMPALKAFARARAKKITSRKVRAKQAREGGQEAARAPSKARAAIKQGDFGSRSIFAAPGAQYGGGLFSAPGRRETNRWQEFPAKRRERKLPQRKGEEPLSGRRRAGRRLLRAGNPQTPEKPLEPTRFVHRRGRTGEAVNSILNRVDPGRQFANSCENGFKPGVGGLGLPWGNGRRGWGHVYLFILNSLRQLVNS